MPLNKIILMILVAAVTMTGCAKKTSLTSTSGNYKGVIIKNTCCLVAIRTISGGDIGQSWTDSGDANKAYYEHAFRVANPCQFGNHAAGDTVSFSRTGAQVQNCMCCMIYTTMPDTTYAITVMQ